MISKEKSKPVKITISIDGEDFIIYDTDSSVINIDRKVRVKEDLKKIFRASQNLTNILMGYHMFVELQV